MGVGRRLTRAACHKIYKRRHLSTHYYAAVKMAADKMAGRVASSTNGVARISARASAALLCNRAISRLFRLIAPALRQLLDACACAMCASRQAASDLSYPLILLLLLDAQLSCLLSLFLTYTNAQPLSKGMDRRGLFISISMGDAGGSVLAA